MGMAIPTFVTIMFVQVIASNMKTTVNDIAITLLGICYVVGFIIFIPILHGMENGKILLWYIIWAAWGTDSFAYYVGIKFGKHKLTKVSPNKSIEGSIGGIIRSNYIFLSIYICCKLLYRFKHFIFIYRNTCSNIKHTWSTWRFSSIKYKKVCGN